MLFCSGERVRRDRQRKGGTFSGGINRKGSLPDSLHLETLHFSKVQECEGESGAEARGVRGRKLMSLTYCLQTVG